MTIENISFWQNWFIRFHQDQQEMSSSFLAIAAHYGNVTIQRIRFIENYKLDDKNGLINFIAESVRILDLGCDKFNFHLL